MSWIEIQNISSSRVDLFDAANTDQVWKVNGIAFDFPPNQSIPQSGVALIVSGDPVLFRAQNSVPPEVPIYGPFEGSIQADGENLRLQMPEKDEPEPEFITIDAVRYSVTEPWPSVAEGSGNSIERVFVNEFGNEPKNWEISENPGGTPGISILPPTAARIESSISSLMSGSVIGENAESVTFNVANFGIETLNYTISETVSWLSVDPVSGSSNGLTDSNTHTINFSTTDLPGGTYETVIQIQSPEADNSPFEIPVTLNVIRPRLSTGSNLISVTTREGQNADNGSLDIWNSNSGVIMNYSLSTDIPWIGITPLEGSSSGPDDKKQHVLTFATSELQSGNYNGNIIINAGNAADSPKVIPVSIIIADGLVLLLDARGLNSGPVTEWQNAGLLGGTFTPEFDSPVAEDVAGVRALTLSGSNDWLTGPPASESLVGNNPHSIEAWVNNPDVGTQETIISWGRQSGTLGGLNSMNHGTQNIYGGVEHWGGAYSAGWENKEEESIWTHVLYTYNGAGQSTLYINSEEVNAKSHGPLAIYSTDTSNRPLPITIGAQNEGNGTRNNSVAGSMSIGLIKVYDRHLSPQTVETKYNAEAASFGRQPTIDIDQDSDGLLLSQEIALGTDPNDPDTDDDGFSDGDEVALGTDPLSADSKLSIQSITIADDSSISIVWSSVPGKTYTIEASENLVDWTSIDTVSASDGTTTAYSDLDSNQKIQQFYRIRLAQ